MPTVPPDLAGTQLDGAVRAERPAAMLDDPPLGTPAPPVAVDAPPLDWSKVMGAAVNALRAHADRVEPLP